MKMADNEKTSPEVADLAAKGLRYPESLTHDQIQSVCASALTQVADKVESAKDLEIISSREFSGADGSKVVIAKTNDGQGWIGFPSDNELVWRKRAWGTTVEQLLLKVSKG